VGDPAIDFNLPDTNNVYHTLQDFSGEILLINFFASWCIPCQQEAPLLEDSVWQVYGNQGVTVLGISVGDSIFQIKNFVNMTGITYPLLRDRDMSYFFQYGPLVFPTNVIVNPQGIIVSLEPGFDIPRLVSIIDSLLNTTGIEMSEPTGNVVRNLELISSYPNPFNSTVNIRYQLQKATDIQMKIYDISGRLLQQENLNISAGIHTQAVNMASNASGIYFFTLQSDDEIQAGKIVLQK
jgi:peroxiredoxin